ncbi:MAG TPA: hypothetical protein VKT30_07940 [Caulobacteraceae bacterium]|nr:hypothetical protein [Caulobacteraceae bacterium]
MIRTLFTGIAAFTLMSGVAFAQDYRDYRDDGTVVYHDPGAHALKGGVAGAGVGALIGCIVTIPIGCGPGAAIGAAVGGGTGAIAGAASTPPPRVYRDRDDYPPPPPY